MQAIATIAFATGVMTITYANGIIVDIPLSHIGPVSTVVTEPRTWINNSYNNGVVDTTPEDLDARDGSSAALFKDEVTGVDYSIDIRDVASPVYATAQALADAIEAAIP